MLKKLLSIICIAGSACAGFAEVQNLDFTYAEGDFGLYGKGKKETIDVAMCINNPSFAGMKLTSLKAYISTLDGITNPSLWLSSELTLENKINVPNIGSYPVNPSLVTVEGTEYGLLEVELPEPYIFTDAPVYLGYSITVESTTTPQQKKPIVYSTGENNNGMFVHMSKSVLKWTNYTSNVGGVAYIVATIEGEFNPYSVNLLGYKTIYTSEDEEFEVELSVSNNGLNPVEILSYTYSVDGSEQQSDGSVLLPAPLPPSLSATYPVTLTFPGISGIGTHQLEITATEVNGQVNMASKPSIDCVINVIPFVPVHRPLVEEYTGLWCGWCPRGFLAMEMISEDYGNNQVSICYHNGDDMAITNNYPVNVSGFPGATIDRGSIIDPYYGSYSSTEFGISLDVENAMAALAIAEIEVNASLNEESVDVVSNTSFISNVNDANYEVGYVLVANGLTEPYWGQSNYYAGEAGYEGTPLEVLTTWPAKVYGLVFNDVAIDVSAMMGISGSLPSTISGSTSYSNTYSFNIEENELVQDPNNLVVAAFIVDKSTGRIVNSNKCAVTKSSAVENFGYSKSETTEYFDLSGRKVKKPSSGIFIKRIKMEDGSIKTSKVILH
ncbi:MAG: hypothetical protein J1F67_06730 [Muribaculaceae bacterium]|nr:hypothetical protein [Muribaculaceae bacterium]